MGSMQVVTIAGTFLSLSKWSLYQLASYRILATSVSMHPGTEKRRLLDMMCLVLYQSARELKDRPILSAVTIADASLPNF